MGNSDVCPPVGPRSPHVVYIWSTADTVRLSSPLTAAALTLAATMLERLRNQLFPHA